MDTVSNDSGLADTGMPPRKSWAGRLGRFAQWLVLLAIAAGLIGLTLARYDVIEKLQGFGAFAGAVLVSLIGGAIGLIALIIGLIGRSGPKRPALIAVGAAAILLLVVYRVVGPGLGAPPLHDITTNVDNPPQFTKLTVRADNLIGVGTIAGWREAHRAGYPEIAPITVAGSPAEVLAKARELAEARGWEIAAYDPATGHMEATAFAAYIRFRDDVIVQVTALEAGGTRVDMRSVSRVGLSDLGYNAARVKEFLGALAAS